MRGGMCVRECMRSHLQCYLPLCFRSIIPGKVSPVVPDARVGASGKQEVRDVVCLVNEGKVEGGVAAVAL